MPKRKRTEDLRPTFTYNGEPVRAGGCLFYANINNEIYYLLRKGKRDWGDIGGKTDQRDKCITDTIVREVIEETNHSLMGDSHTVDEATKALRFIIDKTSKNIFYNKKSKYVLFVLEVPPKIYHMDNKRFGLQEETEDWTMKHYYSWVQKKNIKRHLLHARLRYHKDFSKIF
jgi:hypothetical protein